VGCYSRQGQGVFFLFRMSRPALGPTQPHIQWVPWAFSLGVKWLERDINDVPPSNAKIKNEWN
jgi:hypothetical protein